MGIEKILTKRLKTREIFSGSLERRLEFIEAGCTSFFVMREVSIGVIALTRVSRAPRTISTSSLSSFSTLRRTGRPLEKEKM